MEKVQSFLLELGTGFAYMGREVRIKVGNKEKFIGSLPTIEEIEEELSNN